MKNKKPCFIRQGSRELYIKKVSLRELIYNHFSKACFSFATESPLTKSKTYFCFPFKNLFPLLSKNYSVYFFLLLLLSHKANGQLLTLKDAVQTALNNYGTIKA